MSQNDSATPTNCRAERGRFRSAVLGLSILVVAFGGGAARAAVNISSAPTKNMSCSAGVCSPTARKAVLNVGDLATMLGTSDVKVISGDKAKDIDVTDAVSWVSGNRLTLDAWRSIAISKSVSVAGPGALTIATNEGGTGEGFRFFKKGHVEFWDLDSSLIINGRTYKLVAKIKPLARLIAHDPTGFFALAKSTNAASYGTFTASVIPGLFEGTFEGLGNTISNLSINAGGGTVNVALFAELGFGAPTIRDIGVVSANIMGNATGQCVSVLVGTSEGTVENAYATGQVMAAQPNSITGGLVCANDAGTIKQSYAAVSVSGGDGVVAAGGLVGLNEGSCNMFGEDCLGLIDRSCSTGAVTGGSGTMSGGLVGRNLGGFITDSYASGTADGGSAPVGGLVGSNENDPGAFAFPQIATSYSTTAVSGSDATLGGLIGQDLANPGNTDTYWDLDTSGIGDPSQGAGNIANDPGITGLSDVQLKSALPAGFDPAIWGQDPDINDSYPYLLANPPAN